ncbi:L,D-transpeptidase family protein [Nocardia sp. NEAU-G5]|uniref:L,D-transpeptidase family protein n=1 Tax=Nocardia albiluteola TaxID=2842303 RepID=A0ABS6B8W2_9NOCA|nr:Ig-like domain-containing protein [Nocardia albiluteola]MBU3062557.1 L,D-transpeptidase family protein [Nocardia albiluteola]MBU3065609.1 L,D-transpeptidase family protein [Nocardia albiluteola]
MRTVRQWGAALAVLTAGALVAGCGAPAQPVGGMPDSPSIFQMLTPGVVAPFADRAVGVPVADPLQVRVENGRFTEVSLINPDGIPVSGRIAPDGRSWQITESLGFGRTYHLRAAALGIGGPASADMTFTTMQPDKRTHPWLLPGENEVVGIGQPVAVQFDENIPNRRAVQNAIKVTTVPPVEGAFYWVNPREVRWRPEHFWAPGTRVTVDVNTYGRDLGGGLIGDSEIHSGFTVGDVQVFTADDNTKMVTVEQNGQVVRSMATSMGKNSAPTDNGIYILSDRFDHMIMDSSTYGVAATSPGGYRSRVDWATRMSYSGIFMHSAPWSVWAQGSVDTSHGCLNLSPADARWVYENAKRGDIAIVKNTVGGTLSGVDGLGDWNMPWPQWKAGNADIHR